jgi:hypothetical protein
MSDPTTRDFTQAQRSAIWEAVRQAAKGYAHDDCDIVADEVLVLLCPCPDSAAEVKFIGGPWAGETTTVERVVGPVFAVGHEVGNHYWLDSKSEGTPLYYWDGSAVHS